LIEDNIGKVKSNSGYQVVEIDTAGPGHALLIEVDVGEALHSPARVKLVLNENVLEAVLYAKANSGELVVESLSRV
jgi:hypothetical protein